MKPFLRLQYGVLGVGLLTSCISAPDCLKVSCRESKMLVQELESYLTNELKARSAGRECVIITWPLSVTAEGMHLSADAVEVAVSKVAMGFGFIGFSDRWIADQPRSIRLHRGPPETIMILTGGGHPEPSEYLRSIAEKKLLVDGVPYACGESMSVYLDVPVAFRDRGIKVLREYSTLVPYLVR